MSQDTVATDLYKKIAEIANLGSGVKSEESFTVTFSDPNHLLNLNEVDRPPKTTKNYKQCFREEWMEHPRLRGWLAPDPTNEQRAICKICDRNLGAHKKDLLVHASTKLHQTLAGNSEVTFETDDANITIISHDAATPAEADTIEIIQQSAEADSLPPDSKSPLPRKRRKYTKSSNATPRRIKRERSPSQVTLGSSAQSMAAVESLLGFDLANTLRNLGDIEIHIPMDEDDNDDYTDNLYEGYTVPATTARTKSKKAKLDNVNVAETENTKSASGLPLLRLNTSHCPISSVTVFKDRAQVCRTVDTVVNTGGTEIRIEGFYGVDCDSIKVESSRPVTLTDVSFQLKRCSNRGRPVSEKEKCLADTLQLLLEARRNLDTEVQLQSLDRQYNVMDKFTDGAIKVGNATGAVDAAFAQVMKKFLLRYREFGRQVEGEKAELMRRKYDLDAKIDRVEQALKEVQEKSDHSDVQWECVVVVEAIEDETPIHLDLTYVAHGASWRPTYDFRMNTEDGQLKVFYFGLITQNTGESWPQEVKMCLSTAAPNIGGHIPSLLQTELCLSGNRGRRNCYTGPGPSSDEQNETAHGEKDFGDASITGRTSQKKSLDLETPSISLDLFDQPTIPSDNSPHKVTVNVFELDPNLNYVTVPKVVPNVFVNAKIFNTSGLTLLPGKASVYLDNSLVAKVDLEAVAPQEEFECSLGIAPGVEVSYKPLVKINGTLPDSSKVVIHEQRIELRNLHNTPVNVTVKDNLPHSQDENIKVELQCPLINPVQPDSSEAVLTADNTVVWECMLQALDTREEMLKYTVQFPHGDLNYTHV